MPSVKIDICKCCGRRTYIQNKFLSLCSKCVYEKNHKTKKEFKTKKVARKSTGEKELFLEVWNERIHRCENCGTDLGKIPKAYMFAHIRAKSIDSTNRLNKENIRLLCWDCHDALDKQGKEKYEKRAQDSK